MVSAPNLYQQNRIGQRWLIGMFAHAYCIILGTNIAILPNTRTSIYADETRELNL